MRLQTQRLWLRPIEWGDLDAYHKMSNNAEVMRYVKDGSVLSYEEEKTALKQRIQYIKDNPGLGVFAAFTLDGDEFVGTGNLNHLDQTGLKHIGFRLAQDQWGKGYGTEIATEMLRYGFGDMGLQELSAAVHESNTASIKILTKLGMTYVERVHVYSIWADRYRITREEFVKT